MTLYPIQFVDVYAGNRFSAALEKSLGMRGVLIKAGQGGWPSLPKDFIRQCEQEDLPWGIYWVIDSRYNPEYHMQAIKRTFPDKNFGRLGWWWDCEKPRIGMSDKEYWKTPYAGSGLVESVLDKFLGWSEKTGGIYTSMGFAKLIGWTSPLFRLRSLYAKLQQMPLWAAQYNPLLSSPMLFGPWKNWWGWQYRENPDHNYFNGDEAMWQNFLDGNSTPMPNGFYLYRGEVVAPRGLKVRSGPGIEYQEVAPALKRYTRVEGKEMSAGEPGERWLKIHAPVDGWIAVTYKYQPLVLLEGE